MAGGSVMLELVNPYAGMTRIRFLGYDLSPLVRTPPTVSNIPKKEKPGTVKPRAFVSHSIVSRRHRKPE